VTLWRRLRYLVPSYRRAQEREMSEELESLASIAGPRELGNVTRAAEEARAAWGWTRLEQYYCDALYALRTMRRSPGFAMTALLSLALGIGANAALFSLVNTVLLRNLPVHDPERLVFLDNVGVDGKPNGAPPYPCFERFRDETRSFAGIAAFAAGDFNLSIDGRAEQVFGQYASGSYFNLLGVNAVVGRLLTPEDEQLHPPVAVISYEYWQRRFAGDRVVIGKSISFTGRSLTIIGVTPPDFFGTEPGRFVDVTVPITLQTASLLREKSAWWFEAIARLKPGVPASQARAEVEPIFQSFMDDLHVTGDFRRLAWDHMEVFPASQGLDKLRRRFSRPLLVLMAIVGLVLLIGCANLANLLIARASSRRREFAVRLAIGAGRGRLIRQALTETLLLFAGGAAAGLVVANWGARLLTEFFAVGRSPVRVDTHLDIRVIAYTAGVALVTGILFGLAPAFTAARTDPYPTLKDSESHATASRRRIGARQILVAAQVAFSLVLLVAAGLFVRTLVNLNALTAGFPAERVLTMSIQPLGPAYQGPRLAALWADLLDRVRVLPGVRSASLSLLTPLGGRDRMNVIAMPGFQPRSATATLVRTNHVSEAYFETMGIPVLQGRTFTLGDRQGAPKPALLSEAAAKFYFADRNPLGATLKFNKSPLSDGVYEVVGIVGDTKNMNLREEAPRFVYLPVWQPYDRPNRLTLALRTGDAPASLIPAVRKQIDALGNNILISEVMTMRQQVEATLVEERLLSMLSAFFGILALILSAIGLYGTLSHMVIQRTNEVGIRAALGADRGALIWMILRRSLGVVFAGIAVGLPVALLAARPLQALLYRLRPTDLETLILGTATLLAATLAASYLPARRASQIDPIIALRYE